MAQQPTIQDILQTEFSPPLDTSLIAAIVADYVSGGDANRAEELKQLRSVLSNLAAEAEKELVDADLSDAFAPLHISPFPDDVSSSYEYSTTDVSGYTSTSSGGSDAPGKTSSLDFLRAVFPQVSPENLRNTLAAHGNRIDDINMESLVEQVLTEECMRELEVRGLSESESMEMGYEAPWELVERKKKGMSKQQKKQIKKGTTITLVDIRQQQHARPAPSSSRTAPPDPWTQLASVAAHLSTIIPTHSAAYFQSVFHSPHHPTPGLALRAAMVDIARNNSASGEELTEEESPLLFSMFEILTTSPMYGTLNVEERDQLLEDSLFALRATAHDPNSALELVELLVELDADNSSKEFAWGVYHQQVPKLKTTVTLPSGPPPVPPPPNIPRRSQTAPLPSPSTVKRATPDAWQTIPEKPAPQGPHPLSRVIRAYNPQVPTKGRKARAGGNAAGKGGKGDVGELGAAGAGRRTWELLERRRVALREAGKAWQKRTARNHSGEIAFYFAERARELQQEAQREQLDSAREMVMRSRKTLPNYDVIDLHGTIVVEAVAISRQYLVEYWTPGKQLRIITGRGSHSRNGVGVLGPAVKNALIADGWSIIAIEGGLVVEGLAR
ncbi:uncharacterized protein BXZ73DRAFT_42487 [Epithele typhae]|uniref:uncharacterized protein n=1 Tax=Epithele typhae TaxID=378194 RepID=UPI002008B121|nr:uncharacterized protein BXZ73DRAFT_42487 [Epithele typhae]KAH9940867.1 hypothetical protein BXZ73DRAFT_42487 [Epithele typhae]